MKTESNKSFEIICLGSGSSGNAYVFKHNNECVLVECGFEYKKLVSKLMDNDISVEDIKAVVFTHEHTDHTKSLKSFAEIGIDCYGPISAFNKLGLTSSNCHAVSDKERYTITSWLKVYCFSVCHDCEAYGYAFLNTETSESILFINDTRLFAINKELKNVRFDIIMIECNHIRRTLTAIIKSAMETNDTAKVYKYKRQAEYHMSLASCKKFLSNLTRISTTKAIMLMHLSKDACNDVIVKNEIKSVFKIPTFVCYKEGGIN